MKKQLVVVIVLAVLAALALGSCQSTGAGGGGPDPARLARTLEVLAHDVDGDGDLDGRLVDLATILEDEDLMKVAIAVDVVAQAVRAGGTGEVDVVEATRHLLDVTAPLLKHPNDEVVVVIFGLRTTLDLVVAWSMTE